MGKKEYTDERTIIYWALQTVIQSLILQAITQILVPSGTQKTPVVVHSLWQTISIFFPIQVYRFIWKMLKN